MCRLFGFRSTESQLLVRDLVTAPNSLARQSRKHPDGWGIAHVASEPRTKTRLDRSARPAHLDGGFAAAAKRSPAATLIAHVRKASVGDILVRNTHPFQRRGWVFAHNGTIQQFDSRRLALERAIDRDLRRELQGETDSERLFLLFLSHCGRGRTRDPLQSAQAALRSVVQWVLSTEPANLEKPSSLNSICSDGDRFLALRFNRDLVFSTGARSERPRRTGEKLHSLAVASEPTGAHRRWRRVRNGTGLAVDEQLRLRRFAVV